MEHSVCHRHRSHLCDAGIDESVDRRHEGVSLHISPGGNHWSDIPSLRQQHACRKYDKLEAQSIEKRKAEEKRANEVLKAQQREEREARKLAVAEAKTRMKLAAAKAAGLAPPKSNKHIEKNDTKIMDIASDAHIFLSVMQVEDFQAQSKNIGLVMGEPVLIAASSPWQSQEWSSTRLRSNAVWGGGGLSRV